MTIMKSMPFRGQYLKNRREPWGKPMAPARNQRPPSGWYPTLLGWLGILSQGDCGICKSTKEKRNISGGGAAKTGVTRIDIKIRFFYSTANSSKIQTCSTTHVGTAHGSVSSGMFQIKVTLLMFSSCLKLYTGMVQANRSVYFPASLAKEHTLFGGTPCSAQI